MSAVLFLAPSEKGGGRAENWALGVKVLGIDTASATASAALVEGGRVILEERHPGRATSSTTNRPNHAEIILPLINDLLRKAGLALPSISAIAVSIGPGSFTGLRIGLSTVKGLAYGWEIPVIGVSTLLATAARVTVWEGLICPFLDARKKEVYAGLFYKEGESLKRLTEDLVSAPGKIIRLVEESPKKGPCLFVGDGVRTYGELIQKSLRDGNSSTVGEDYPSTASAVARLGEERCLKNDFDSLGPMVPSYLRPSEAEVKRGLQKGNLSKR